MMPSLTFASSGRKQSYGDFNSNAFIGKLLESCKQYGPATGYLTFAFDDRNNPRAFRASHGSVSNSSFPAMFSGRNAGNMNYGESIRDFNQSINSTISN